MDNEECGNDCSPLAGSIVDEKQARRPRKATLLNLQWIRERILKTEELKESVDSDAYQVDSQKLAKALMGSEE